MQAGHLREDLRGRGLGGNGGENSLLWHKQLVYRMWEKHCFVLHPYLGKRDVPEMSQAKAMTPARYCPKVKP